MRERDGRVGGPWGGGGVREGATGKVYVRAMYGLVSRRHLKEMTRGSPAYGPAKPRLIVRLLDFTETNV